MAPGPEVVHVFDGPDGLKKYLKGVVLDKGVLQLEDKVCCFSYASESVEEWAVNLPDFAIDQYTLSVEGKSLILTNRHGRTTLIDFSDGPWKIPVVAWGSEAHRYPAEASCKKIGRASCRERGLRLV